MNAADPSEADPALWADILKLLPDYFDVFEINGYGGSLLHLLLEGITGNFVEDNPRSMSYLQSFFDLEDRLIASGRLQHDFAQHHRAKEGRCRAISFGRGRSSYRRVTVVTDPMNELSDLEFRGCSPKRAHATSAG